MLQCLLEVCTTGMRVLSDRCGFESQLSTVSGSVYSVLHGTSRAILLIGFGGSDVPDRLYSRPEPPGRAKNTLACTHRASGTGTVNWNQHHQHYCRASPHYWHFGERPTLNFSLSYLADRNLVMFLLTVRVSWAAFNWHFVKRPCNCCGSVTFFYLLSCW